MMEVIAVKKINFTLSELVMLLGCCNLWNAQNKKSSNYSTYETYYSKRYVPLSLLIIGYYYYYYHYYYLQNYYYYYSPKGPHLFTSSSISTVVHSFNITLLHPDYATYDMTFHNAGEEWVGYIQNPSNEDDYIVKLWTMIQSRFNEWNCLLVPSSEYNIKLKKHANFGEYSLYSPTVTYAPDLNKHLCTFALSAFDCQPYDSRLRGMRLFTASAQDVFIKINDIIDRTYDRYVTLLKKYEEEEENLTARLKQVRNVSSSTDEKSRFNDTPQIEDDGTLDGDIYATQISHNKGQGKSKEQIETDPTTIMARLDEIGRDYRNLWAEWVDEFSGIFYPKSDEQIDYEYFGGDDSYDE